MAASGWVRNYRRLCPWVFLQLAWRGTARRQCDYADREYKPPFSAFRQEERIAGTAAFGREPLLAALKLAAVEGPLCGQNRPLAKLNCL
jgi:hypothetical protein